MVKTNVSQLQERFKSKSELYKFLSQDCGLYLPKCNCTNVYFLKDIMTGKKEVSCCTHMSLTPVVCCQEVSQISAVPKIIGLTAEGFLTFARRNQDLLKYLPEEKDWNHLDKQWLCDILYILNTDRTESMITNAKKDRQKKLEVKRNEIVEIRLEFSEAL